MTHPFDSADQVPAAGSSERRPAKKHRGRKVLIAVAVVVALVAVVAGGYLFNLARTFDSGTSKIEQAFPDESTRPKKTNTSMNILVMGSDSRGAAEPDAASTPTDQRADTLMLMHIPADRKNIYTMSIMRDLWVDIPGHGEAKINSALALGGTPLMVQTIESIFQQRIDHVAMIDFEGFKGLTDALGGVTVNIKLPFTSNASAGPVLRPGPAHLRRNPSPGLRPRTPRLRRRRLPAGPQPAGVPAGHHQEIDRRPDAEQPNHHQQHGRRRLAVRHCGQDL